MATNPLKIYLSLNNGDERFQLPVNPEFLRVTSTYGYEDVNVSQLGEYTVFAGNRLSEFSFASFLPRDYDPSYCEYTPVPNPWNIVNRIGKWRAAGVPIRLTIAGTPINILVSIRSFSYEERGGSPGDLSFEIELKEYVIVTFKRYSEMTDKATKFSAEKTTDTRTSTKTTPASYTVKSGDSLFKIAHRVYSDGDRWREIYSANKKAIGANPNVLAAGLKLVIPL